MQASQRVLAIPELVSQILEFTAADFVSQVPERQRLAISGPTRLASSDSRVTLYNCAKVNHRRFWEAMRHLWIHLTWKKLKALEQMRLERRQLYASFVKALSLDCHPCSKYQTRILDGLVFSRVLSVNIRFWDHLRRFYIPKIQVPALQVLDLNVYKVEVTDEHVLFDRYVEEGFTNLCKVRTLCLVRMQARDII
jgi:hypothetical protein